MILPQLVSEYQFVPGILSSPSGKEESKKGKNIAATSPPVYIVFMVFYGVQYLSGRFRSAVLAVLPPRIMGSSSLAEHRKLYLV